MVRQAGGVSSEHRRSTLTSVRCRCQLHWRTSGVCIELRMVRPRLGGFGMNIGIMFVRPSPCTASFFGRLAAYLTSGTALKGCGDPFDQALLRCCLRHPVAWESCPQLQLRSRSCMRYHFISTMAINSGGECCMCVHNYSRLIAPWSVAYQILQRMSRRTRLEFMY